MYIHHPYPAGWRIPVLRDHFEFVNSILDRRWENLSILLDVDSKLISTAEPFSSLEGHWSVDGCGGTENTDYRGDRSRLNFLVWLTHLERAWSTSRCQRSNHQGPIKTSMIMSHYQTLAIRHHGGNDVIITISLHDDKMLYSDDTTIPTTDKGHTRWYISQWFPNISKWVNELHYGRLNSKKYQPFLKPKLSFFGRSQQW